MSNVSVDFKLSSYNFQLPQELIATRPAVPRDHSRLLVVRNGAKQIDSHFFDLARHLPQNTLLIVNETQVFKARLKARKQSGGKAEIFLLGLTPDKEAAHLCLLRTNSSKKIGDCFDILDNCDDVCAQAILLRAQDDGAFLVRIKSKLSVAELVAKVGQVPIPPYIRQGSSDERDESDYQTMFARKQGSVAAPTAGLHFTPRVIENLSAKKIDMLPVLLHVGIGTFLPVKSQDIREHRMHREEFLLSRETFEALSKAWKNQQPIVAVGTTSLRVIETVYRWIEKGVTPKTDCWHSTDIFLYPGQKIQSVQGLITNFHLPESSLFMLTCAMMGREYMQQLYADAIQKKYRFFSYGDAMLLLP